MHEVYLTLDQEDQAGNSCKDKQEPMKDSNYSYNRFCGKYNYPGGLDEGIRFCGLLNKTRQIYWYVRVGVVRKLTPMMH